MHTTTKERANLFLLADQVLSEDIAPWEEDERIQMEINLAHGTYRLLKDYTELDEWLTDAIAIQTILRAEFWCYEEDNDYSPEYADAIDIMESAIRYINARGGRNVEECAEVLRRRAAGIEGGLETIPCETTKVARILDNGMELNCWVCAEARAARFRKVAQELDPELNPEPRPCSHSTTTGRRLGCCVCMSKIPEGIKYGQPICCITYASGSFERMCDRTRGHEGPCSGNLPEELHRSTEEQRARWREEQVKPTGSHMSRGHEEDPPANAPLGGGIFDGTGGNNDSGGG